MSIILKKDGVDLIDDKFKNEVAKEVNEITGMIEQKFDPVDKTYSLTTINFNSQKKQCTQVFEAQKTIIIHLSDDDMEDGRIYYRKLHLSHEFMHTVTPCEDLKKIIFLEEGLATVFSEEYTGGCNSNPPIEYALAKCLVSKLLGIDREIIKKMRKKHLNKKISDYTIQDIMGENPLVDINLAQGLTQKFY